MLDIRIMFGAFVVCVSIFVIGARLLATNETLIAKGSEKSELRISASERPELNVSAAARPPLTPARPASTGPATDRPSTAASLKPAIVPITAPAAPAPAVTAAKPAETPIPARTAARPDARDITGSIGRADEPVIEPAMEEKPKPRRTARPRGEPDTMDQLMTFFYKHSIAK